MFPHERSLVEKMKDEPFALVGVNSDPNFEELKRKEFIDEKITWRSFQNEGGEKPISEQWSVQGWPTLYLIDAQGNLRKKWVGAPPGEVLDAAIEKLVVEAKAKGGKPAPAGEKKAEKKAKSGS